MTFIITELYMDRNANVHDSVVIAFLTKDYSHTTKKVHAQHCSQTNTYRNSVVDG